MLRKESSIIVKASINIKQNKAKALIGEGFVFLSQKDSNKHSSDSGPEANHLNHSSDAGCA